jgi:hypothetical protein
VCVFPSLKSGRNEIAIKNCCMRFKMLLHDMYTDVFKSEIMFMTKRGWVGGGVVVMGARFTMLVYLITFQGSCIRSFSVFQWTYYANKNIRYIHTTSVPICHLYSVPEEVQNAQLREPHNRPRVDEYPVMITHKPDVDTICKGMQVSYFFLSSHYFIIIKSTAGGW